MFTWRTFGRGKVRRGSPITSVVWQISSKQRINWEIGDLNPSAKGANLKTSKLDPEFGIRNH